jgi:hypothetical protein
MLKKCRIRYVRNIFGRAANVAHLAGNPESRAARGGIGLVRHQSVRKVAQIHDPAKIQLLQVLTQFIILALALALPSAGNSIAARIAMMAITTSNSINVKPFLNSLQFLPLYSRFYHFRNGPA